MAIAKHFLTQTLSQLSHVAPVYYKRLFNEVGLYHRGQLFGLVVEHRVYFRVDDSSVLPYRARGMECLRPKSAQKSASHFYQLPPEVLNNPPELTYWLRAAVEASLEEERLNTETDASQIPSDAASNSRLLAG